jgi:SAM-dependent methyltransferase
MRPERRGEMTPSTTATTDHDAPLGAHLAVHKMPAHWLMARLGKGVMRPGGVEMTEWLIAQGRIATADDVVEFAPGLGRTARLILSRAPATYTGVERDSQAAIVAEGVLAGAGNGVRILRGDASQVPLPDASASVDLGEAMLSMQTAGKKRAIVREAHRILTAGGRYLIHELAVQPETIDRGVSEGIQRDLSSTIHVGVRIGTASDWAGWLREAGFEVEALTTAPMRLLERDRMIRDEGLLGTARFVFNVLRTPGAHRRLMALRRMFRRHQAHLCAVGIVARRAE